jgi:hypothetical protein
MSLPFAEQFLKPRSRRNFLQPLPVMLEFGKNASEKTGK